MPTKSGNDFEPLENLNKGLLNLYNKIKPSTTSHQLRKAVIKRVKRLIQIFYTNSEVHVFGSFKTRLYLNTSDIDMAIIINDDTDRVLGNIKSLLIGHGITNKNSAMFIRGARVPILKFTDLSFGFKFDICVNNLNGLEAVEFIKGVVKERPYLEVFFILLKHFMVSRNLGDASMGGLNSYSQFLMIYSFFQLHPLVQSNAIDPIENLGVLFIEFFQYYGFDFQFQNVSICVENVQYKRNWTGRCCIIDPTDKETNTGSNCRNIRSILKVFQYAYRTMVCSIKTYKEGKKGVSLSEKWFPSRKI
jgi:non-canonical poly(A) RNA polymerase PAPD5/7